MKRLREFLCRHLGHRYGPVQQGLFDYEYDFKYEGEPWDRMAEQIELPFLACRRCGQTSLVEFPTLPSFDRTRVAYFADPFCVPSTERKPPDS